MKSGYSYGEGGQDPYTGYDYADGPIRIFKQRKTLRGRGGDVERYFNLMAAGTEGEIGAHRITRIGEGAVRMEGPDGATVFGVMNGEARVGRFEIAAGAFALTDPWIVLLDGTRLSIGEASFGSDAPVHLIAHPGEGRGEIRVESDTSVTVRNVPGIRFDGRTARASDEVLPPGTHRFSLRGRPPDGSFFYLPGGRSWEPIR